MWGGGTVICQATVQQEQQQNSRWFERWFPHDPKQALRTRSSRVPVWSLSRLSLSLSRSVSHRERNIDQEVKVWVRLMSRACLMTILHLFTLTQPRASCRTRTCTQRALTLLHTGQEKTSDDQHFHNYIWWWRHRKCQSYKDVISLLQPP